MFETPITKTEKKYGDDKIKSRAALIRIAGVTGILANVLFAAIKFVIGTAANSIAITSDAVNNPVSYTHLYEMTTIYENAVQHNQNGGMQGGGKVNTRAAIRVKDKPVGKVYYTADNADGYLLSIYPRILIKRRMGQ